MTTQKYLLKVNSLTFSFASSSVSVNDILKEYRATAPCDLLVQIFRGGDRKILNNYEIVDLSASGHERFEAYESSKVVYFSVNDEKLVTDKPAIKAEEILEIAGLFPVSDYYVALMLSGSENFIVSNDEAINIKNLGEARFEATLKDKAYTISVEGKKRLLRNAVVTGEEILRVSGKLPVTDFELIQKFKDQQRSHIGLGTQVDLAAEGIEKFVAIPCDQREGGL